MLFRSALQVGGAHALHLLLCSWQGHLEHAPRGCRGNRAHVPLGWGRDFHRILVRLHAVPAQLAGYLGHEVPRTLGPRPGQARETEVIVQNVHPEFTLGVATANGTSGRGGA